ncbi:MULTISPECIES: HNH endonuclease signature motif containing protein [unclassified Erwinia]|uniref:HNH endonuclease signature motif containing protein n=1 Tax=unclassified Erwinia TaxID=2622719 RepID=UPI0013040607|nr:MULTISPECIES: HNH endonuclease signature motif containing protein [unclassified Erwinia]
MKTKLREAFEYRNGQLTWKYRPISHFKSPHAWKSTNSRLAGKPAGKVRANGYVTVYLDGKNQYVHRLIWVYHFGNIPENMEIDHINHNRTDNRIENLRLVTRAENALNLGQRHPIKRNGVTWRPEHKRWYARITVHGKRLHLGTFINFEAALAARLHAEREHGFQHVRRIQPDATA